MYSGSDLAGAASLYRVTEILGDDLSCPLGQGSELCTAACDHRGLYSGST